MASDNYTLYVLCPDCGSKGEADARENDGWSYMNRGPEREITRISQGFTVIDHGRHRDDKLIIHCECGAVARTGFNPPQH